MPTMGVAGWLKCSRRDDVIAAIKTDCYSVAYPHLVRHFRAGKEQLNWEYFVIGLHIVYGWMPTIPELKYTCTNENDVSTSLQQSDQLELLESLKSAAAASGDLNVDEAEKIITNVSKRTNHSLIGASKLLHFLNPEVFPIWDSRVAYRFADTDGRPTYQKVNKVQLWKQYFSAVAEWRINNEVMKVCNELRMLGNHFNGVTNTRMIELVLFHPAPTDWGKSMER